MSDIAAQIAAYLAHVMANARDLRVDEVARIHGGASQEMFRFCAHWSENDERIERRFVLRREPAGGLVEAERDLEFKIYRALAGSGIPVPKAHFLELDGAWLERAFFIMDLAPGKPGHFYMSGDPYEGRGEQVARHFWRHLGALARLDHAKLGLSKLRNGEETGGFARRELAHWTALLDKNELHPEPILRGAVRELLAALPADPAKPSIVHGDYRSGNFLFTPDGQISAILDWEMAHIGDGIEDVAWALDVMWPMTRHLPLDEGLAVWQAASGRALDRAALAWWRLFSAFKASVLWATAAKTFDADPHSAIVLVMTAVNGGHIHRQEILRLMKERRELA